MKNPPQNVLNGVEQRCALFKSPLLYQVELRACVRNFLPYPITSASSDSSAGSGSGEPENGLSTGFHSRQGVRCVRGGARAPSSSLPTLLRQIFPSLSCSLSLLWRLPPPLSLRVDGSKKRAKWS